MVAIGEETGQVERPGVVMAVACVGVVLGTLDLFIVSVALPSIGRAFGGASLDDLSWVLNAYAVVYAALLVFVGRMAEGMRRERAYLAGLALFTAASAGCAMAGGVWTLVAFRVVQAAGAALMTSTSLGLVLAAYPASERGGAARLWTAVGGFAGALGPVAGGLLLSFGWEWIFLVNVPIGLAALVIGWRVLPEVPGQVVQPPSPLGAVLITAGVALLILGLVSAEGGNWNSAGVRIGLTGGPLLIAAFALHCLRARNPLVDPALFRNRVFTGAALALLAFMTAFGAFLLSRVLWDQTVWGWSALKTGLALAPGPFMVPVTSILVAGRLIPRIGAGGVVALGLLCFSAACAAMAVFGPAGPSLVLSVGSAVLSGIGVGLVLPTLMGTAAGALPATSFSTGSGVLNMIRQTGMAIGVALLVLVIGTAGQGAEAGGAYRIAWAGTIAIALASLLPMLAARTRG